MNVKQFFKVGAAALVGGLAVSTASANLIDGYTVGTAGGTSYVDPATGIVVNAFGGNFTPTDKLGVKGFGISGGNTFDEIDLLPPFGSEGVTFTSPIPIYVGAITLGVLYEGPEFGDVQESVLFTGFGPGSGSPYSFVLRTVYSASGTVATFENAQANVNNLQPAISPNGSNPQGGVWQVTNPFGNVLLTSFSLSAIPGACGTGACNNQSDFAVVGAQVPIPGTIALLGLGVLGLGVVARKRRA